LLEVELHEFSYESYSVDSHSTEDDVIVCSAEDAVGKGKPQGGGNEATPIFYSPERGGPLDPGGLSHSMVHCVPSEVRLGPGRALRPLDELTGNNRV